VVRLESSHTSVYYIWEDVSLVVEVRVDGETFFIRVVKEKLCTMIERDEVSDR